MADFSHGRLSNNVIDEMGVYGHAPSTEETRAAALGISTRAYVDALHEIQAAKGREGVVARSALSPVAEMVHAMETQQTVDNHTTKASRLSEVAKTADRMSGFPSLAPQAHALEHLSFIDPMSRSAKAEIKGRAELFDMPERGLGEKAATYTTNGLSPPATTRADILGQYAEIDAINAAYGHGMRGGRVTPPAHVTQQETPDFSKGRSNLGAPGIAGLAKSTPPPPEPNSHANYLSAKGLLGVNKPSGRFATNIDPYGAPPPSRNPGRRGAPANVPVPGRNPSVAGWMARGAMPPTPGRNPGPQVGLPGRNPGYQAAMDLPGRNPARSAPPGLPVGPEFQSAMNAPPQAAPSIPSQLTSPLSVPTFDVPGLPSNNTPAPGRGVAGFAQPGIAPPDALSAVAPTTGIEGVAPSISMQTVPAPEGWGVAGFAEPGMTPGNPNAGVLGAPPTAPAPTVSMPMSAALSGVPSMNTPAPGLGVAGFAQPGMAPQATASQGPPNSARSAEEISMNNLAGYQTIDELTGNKGPLGQPVGPASMPGYAPASIPGVGLSGMPPAGQMPDFNTMSQAVPAGRGYAPPEVGPAPTVSPAGHAALTGIGFNPAIGAFAQPGVAPVGPPTGFDLGNVGRSIGYGMNPVSVQSNVPGTTLGYTEEDHAAGFGQSAAAGAAMTGVGAPVGGIGQGFGQAGFGSVSSAGLGSSFSDAVGAAAPGGAGIGGSVGPGDNLGAAPDVSTADVAAAMGAQADEVTGVDPADHAGDTGGHSGGGTGPGGGVGGVGDGSSVAGSAAGVDPFGGLDFSDVSGGFDGTSGEGVGTSDW